MASALPIPATTHRVIMVSADAGKKLAQAALQEPVLPKAFTRFRMPGAGTASRSCCRAAPTSPATCNRLAPSPHGCARPAPKSPGEPRWRSPTSTITASRAGASRATGRSSTFMRNAGPALAVALSFGAGTAAAETPGLGKPITEADITAWNIDVLPDGTGLPPGSGTAKRRARRSMPRNVRCATARTASIRRAASPMVGPSKFDRIERTVPDYKLHCHLDAARRARR